MSQLFSLTTSDIAIDYFIDQHDPEQNKALVLMLRLDCFGPLGPFAFHSYLFEVTGILQVIKILLHFKSVKIHRIRCTGHRLHFYSPQELCERWLGFHSLCPNAC